MSVTKTPEETVAAAIYVAEHPHRTWASAPCKPPYLDMARAAISAMPSLSREAPLIEALEKKDRMLAEAESLLSGSHSGYISGTRYDMEFDKNRDEWLSEYQTALKSTAA